jgi:hypothetical protein
MLATVVEQLAELTDDAFIEHFRHLELEHRRLHGANAPTSLLARTDAQRRFDALASICRRSVNVPANAKAPIPVVNIIIDFSQRRSETTNGTPLVPDVAIRAALQGHVRRVVFNSAGVVINMGRKRRLFTGAARHAAQLMATRCDFPGCDVPGAHTQIDHLDEWYRDGAAMLAVGRRHPDNLPDNLPNEHDIEYLTQLAQARVAALRRAA